MLKIRFIRLILCIFVKIIYYTERCGWHDEINSVSIGYWGKRVISLDLLQLYIIKALTCNKYPFLTSFAINLQSNIIGNVNCLLQRKFSSDLLSLFLFFSGMAEISWILAISQIYQRYPRYLGYRQILT